MGWEVVGIVDFFTCDNDTIRVKNRYECVRENVLLKQWD